MCEISKVAEDWIVKGCHIHVQGVELLVRPNHLGGILMKKGFSSTDDRDADAAVHVAVEWLADVENRQKLIREIEKARRFVLGEFGHLKDLARGRGAEFTFLLAALGRVEV
jgi:hypothetical protein